MSGVCRNMARAFFWCRIPFTYGKVRKTRREVDSSPTSGLTEPTELGQDAEEDEQEMEFAESADYDGLISSIQMLIGLVVTVTVVVLSCHMAKNKDLTDSKLLLIVLMAVDLVLMICIYRYRVAFLLPQPLGTAGEAGHSVRDNLTLIGTVTFCTLGCLFSFVRLMELIACSGEWIFCQNRSIVRRKIVSCVFNVMRIVYLAGQTVFCLVFNRSKFSDSSLTRHALMYLLSVNVIFWCQELISDADHLLRHEDEDDKHRQLVQLCFANDTNITINLLQCYSRNGTMYKLVNNYAVPILRPFLIEFTLLVGECLVHWFLSCGGESDHESELSVRTTLRRRSTSRGTHNTTNRASTQIEDNTVPVVSRNNDAEVTDCDLAEDEHTPLLGDRFLARDDSRPLALMLWIGLAVVCSLLLFVFAFLPKLMHDKSFDSIFDKCYYHYTMLYYLLMIIFIALGYGFSNRFKVETHAPFTGLDYLLIFTSSGPLAIGAFKIQATLMAPKRLGYEDLIGAYRASVCLELIQAAFQLAFVLYAGRIRVENRAETDTRRSCFRAIVFYLALCNGVLWCTQTFSAGSAGVHFLRNYFGQTGRVIIVVVLTPMSLFFRFNSCLLFARIFCQTKSKDQRRV